MRRFILWLRGFHLHREKPKATDWIVVGLTLVVAIAAFYSAWVFQGQLTAANKELELSERPWIALEIAKASPFRFAPAGGAGMTIDITMHNLGHSPAIEIYRVEKLLPWPTGDGTSDVKEACREAAQYRDHLQLTTVLFPSQPTPRPEGVIVSIGKEDLDKFHETHGEAVLPEVVVCVSYRSTFSAQSYETGQGELVYRLDPATPGALLVMHPKDGDVPVDRLFMLQHPTLAD